MLRFALPTSTSLVRASRSQQGWRAVTSRHCRQSHVPSRSPMIGGGGGGKVPGRRLCATGGGGPGDNPKSSGMWAKYLELLDSHPLLTRSATCALLNGLGDVFSQLFVEKAELNTQRTLTFTMLGFAFVGPAMTYWYRFLGGLIPGNGIPSVLGSLALDQLVFAPCFIAAFMSILTSIEGKPEAVRSKLERDLLPAVKVNWGLWVPAQFINFRFVPPNLRVLATNVTALVWNVYMSYQSHKTH